MQVLLPSPSPHMICTYRWCLLTSCAAGKSSSGFLMSVLSFSCLRVITRFLIFTVMSSLMKVESFLTVTALRAPSLCSSLHHSNIRSKSCPFSLFQTKITPCINKNSLCGWIIWWGGRPVYIPDFLVLLYCHLVMEDIAIKWAKVPQNNNNNNAIWCSSEEVALLLLSPFCAVSHLGDAVIFKC